MLAKHCLGASSKTSSTAGPTKRFACLHVVAVFVVAIVVVDVCLINIVCVCSCYFVCY